MQKPGKLQAVIILVVMAIASGCAATKEYTSKLFKPATGQVKDSQAVALRFLELEELDGDQENWVNTSDLKQGDSLSDMIAIEKIDRLATVKPAIPDSTLLKKPEIKPVDKEAVVKKAGNGEVREKRVRE
jgi:hypothetical protein